MLSFYQLINEIRKLNPGVEIRVGNPNFDAFAYNRIFCSVPMESLTLPDGYYSNSKNGITNKHNTEDGFYISLSVETLENMREGYVYPNVDVNQTLETTNVEEIAIAIQKLNPGVNIKLANPDLVPDANHMIYSDVAANFLALPEPFVYNDKNGITNKHKSESGMYTTISVEELDKANPAYLIETGYNTGIQNVSTSKRVTKREKVKLTAQQLKEKLTAGLSNLSTRLKELFQKGKNAVVAKVKKLKSAK